MAAMLPILAAMNLLCAWLIRRLATAEHVKRAHRAGRHRARAVVDAAAIRAARARERALSRQPRGARPDRHGRRRAARLRVQAAGDLDIRTGRRAAAILRGLLRGHQPAHVSGPGHVERAGAGAARPRRQRGDAVGRAPRRQRRRAGRAGTDVRGRGARRRGGVPRLRSSAPATKSFTRRSRRARNGRRSP